MKPRTGTVLRLATPLKVLVQRFAFLLLAATTFGLMMLGKADMVLLDRVRTATADAVAPVLEALSRPAATLGEMTAELRELAHLRAENARLKAANARLLHWQEVARRLEAENRSLKRLLRVPGQPPPRFVTARVIADPGDAFARSLLVNAGRRDGVRRGQAVLSPEGLVGRVMRVGRRSARVLLLVDLNSRIPVRIETSRERAILAGDNSDRPRLIHLRPEARVSPGERVVTSGHAGALPPGIPVGIVASVAESGIRVRPFADWTRLEFVRIADYGLDGRLPLPERAAAGGE